MVSGSSQSRRSRTAASRVAGRLGLASRERQLLLSMTIVTRAPLADPRVCDALRRLLCSVSHPLLSPLEAVDFPVPGNAAITVRGWAAAGSLRDLMRSAEPSHASSEKYARVGTNLPERKCARFALLVLDALRVLAPLGAPLAQHVHCGNLLVRDDTGLIRLSEWENALLGLTSQHTDSLVQELAPSLSPHAAALVLCLYEMGCGFELEALPPVFPPECPASVVRALEPLLQPPRGGGAGGGGVGGDSPMDLEELAALPFFRDARRVEGASALPSAQRDAIEPSLLAALDDALEQGGWPPRAVHSVGPDAPEPA